MNNNSFISPSSQKYFHGRLLNEEAKKLLLKNSRDGLFLLREKLTDVGWYFLSICYENKVYDYEIKRQETGTVKIESPKASFEFVGPVELINYYKYDPNNFFITKLDFPCDRQVENPVNYFILDNSVLIHNIDKKITEYLNAVKITFSKENFNQEKIDARGRFRYRHEKKALQELHLSQDWYAPFELNLTDEQFVVRKTDSKNNEHIISLCHNNEIKNLTISFKSIESDKYSLQNDQNEFDSIIQLVDYFYRNGFNLNDSKESFTFNLTEHVVFVTISFTILPFPLASAHDRHHRSYRP